MLDITRIAGRADMRVKYRMANELLVDRIVAAMEAKSLLVKDVTEAAGCDRDYITQLRKEKSGKPQDPGAKRLKRLADAIGVPVTWLIAAIDPDEKELARGVRWPPLNSQVEGNLSEEAESQELLDIWLTIDRRYRNAALVLMEGVSRAARKVS